MHLVRKGLISLILLSGYAAVYSQCNNIFVKPDTNLSCAPGAFQFVVYGAPSGSKFEWNFGKGYTPGTDTFSFIQTTAGDIPLILNTALPTGTQCITKYSSIAKVFANPKPVYSVDKTLLCSVADSVRLTDKTPNSVYRIWTYGGQAHGDTSASRIAKFKVDGKQSITMMVEDTNGCRGVKSFANVVEILPQEKISIISQTKDECVNKPVQFTFTSSASQASILSTSWSFQDGIPNSSTASVPPPVRFKSGGNKAIQLTISTRKGCTYSTRLMDVVRIRDSTILDVRISDSSFCTPKEITISANPSQLYGPMFFHISDSIDRIYWDSLTEYSRRVKVYNGGVYDLEMSYHDSFCVSRFSKKSFMSAHEVRALPRSTQYYDCEVPFLAKFTNGSYASDPGKLSYRWAVYDTLGKFLKGAITENFDFLVRDSGYYDLELIVTHPNGCGDTMYGAKRIRADSIRIDATAIPKVVCQGQDVLIKNNSFSSTYQATDRYKWWIFKHGDSVALDSSVLYEPRFTINDTGSFDVRAYAENDVGCTQTFLLENAFHVDEPKAYFKVERPTNCVDDTFSILSRPYPPDGDYISFWTLHNATDTFYYQGPNPLAKIPKPGVYDLTNRISIFGFCRDTFSESQHIFITGIKTSIDLPGKRACRGLDYKPKAKSDNYVFNGNDTIKYEWKVYPSDGCNLVDGDKATPTLQFNKNGIYRLRVITVNSESCRDTTFSDTIFVGMDPQIVFHDTAVCYGAPIRISHRADSFTTKWFFRLSDTSGTSIQQVRSDSTVVWLKNPGSYTLDILASRDSLCFDTIQETVAIVSPVAAFDMLDSNLFCAPAYQRFQSNSLYADTMFWDFGDGKSVKTTTQRVTTLYTENTGKIKPYSVQLIAKNRTGCADTLVKKDLVRIDGPAFDVKLSQTRGCEPLEVAFTGKTDQVKRMYIDYGDGTNFGNKSGAVHPYMNKWRIVEQQYKPLILLVDSIGCQTLIKLDSIIYVKPSPTADISLEDSIACQSVSPRYFYLGNEATNWYWDFESDGTIDEVNKVSGRHNYNKPGRYRIQLTNENNFDCHDTAVAEVHAVNPPQARLVADSFICNGNNVVVYDTSVWDAPVDLRSWVYEEAKLLDDQDSALVLEPNSKKPVKVIIRLRDSIGCEGSDSVFVRIRDSSNAEPARIYVVSVTNDTVIDINSKQMSTNYLTTNFERDRNSLKDTVVITGKSIPNTDTLLSVYSGPTCYKVQHFDSCGFANEASQTHCTVFLKVAVIGTRKLELDWTDYVGWSGVQNYRIYRNGSQVADVPGNQLTYLDSGLCDELYCYRIVASSPGDSFRSYSNTVCAKPVYTGNDLVFDVDYATVRENNYVEVFVNNAGTTDEFVLTKSDKNGSVDIPLIGSQYDDMNVDVQTTSYRYAVKNRNNCEDLGGLGKEGTSILFMMEAEADSLRFNWNPYNNWTGGVSSYIVQRKQSGTFMPLLSVPGSDTSVSIRIESSINTSNCFRVAAVRTDGVMSVSNEQCIQRSPIVLVPNAFSPNNDVLNEVFKPTAMFLKSPLDYPNEGLYSFSVYNSWGEMVYSTNDPNVGWDGFYLGKKAPLGVYSYMCRLKGLDNQIYHFSGSVTLIR